MCGEKMDYDEVGMEMQGSPPRMRGKELAVGVIRQHGGITPAHAGKRACTTTGTTRRKDHPRVCGEKTYYQDSVYTTPGSPPHVRGKVGNRPGGQLPVGITPACAGKSSGHMQRFGTSGDHPRVCGEKSASLFWFVLFWGSPPHVRGKAPRPHRARPVAGITPACAGKRR